MKWLYRLVIIIIGVISLIVPPSPWMLKYGWIMVWIGVALLAARELFGIGADFLFAESHRKMTGYELLFHWLLVISFAAIGLSLNQLLHSRFGITALFIPAALVEELGTRHFLTLLLRLRLGRDLRAGQISSAQSVGLRLFHVMIICGISDNNRYWYLDFGN